MGSPVNVFIPGEVTPSILKKITFSIEIMFESCRQIYKRMTLFMPVEYTIFSSGNRHSFVSNIRLLALVYSHFYDLDMVTFSSLTDHQLRLMNFFSLELEDLQ